MAIVHLSVSYIFYFLLYTDHFHFLLDLFRFPNAILSLHTPEPSCYSILYWETMPRHKAIEWVHKCTQQQCRNSRQYTTTNEKEWRLRFNWEDNRKHQQQQHIMENYSLQNYTGCENIESIWAVEFGIGYCQAFAGWNSKMRMGEDNVKTIMWNVLSIMSILLYFRYKCFVNRIKWLNGRLSCRSLCMFFSTLPRLASWR